MRRGVPLNGALVGVISRPVSISRSHAAGVLGEALGGLLALALQRQVDVVVVDEHRAEARPARFPLHFDGPQIACFVVASHAKVQRAQCCIPCKL